MSLPRRRALEIYRLRKLAILFFFIAYAVVQYAGHVGSPRGEYFPVFSWSLFTEVMNPRSEVQIEVLRIGETEFSPPADYFELGEHFARARTRSSDVVKGVTRLFVLYHEDPAAAEAARRTFEQTFLADRDDVEYQLVVATFDPLHRWTAGEFIERRIAARFSTGQAR